LEQAHRASFQSFFFFPICVVEAVIFWISILHYFAIAIHEQTRLLYECSNLHDTVLRFKTSSHLRHRIDERSEDPRRTFKKTAMNAQKNTHAPLGQDKREK